MLRSEPSRRPDLSGRGPGAGLWRQEIRALLGLAVPLALAELSFVAISTTDIVMMGWLGADALAAGSLGGHFYATFYFFAVGVVSAAGPMIAQVLGARKTRAVRHIVRQGFWTAAGLGLLFTAVIWQVRPILIAFGQDPAIAALAEPYVRAMVVGLVPGIALVVLWELASAHSRPRAALVVSVIGIGINVLGNYCLMFGNFGFPRLGLTGAGISSAIVSTYMFLALLGFVLWDRQFRRYAILSGLWRADWPRLREIFAIGVPLGFTGLAEVGIFVASAFMIGLIGTRELAAHAVALQCLEVAIMIPVGLRSAASVRVGLAAGAGDAAGVRRAGWTALGLVAGYALALGLLIYLLRWPLVGLFLDLDVADNQPVAALAVTFLTIGTLFLWVDSAQIVAAGVLQGLKDTRVPMALALFGFWVVGISAGWTLGLTLGWGGVGVWTGLALGIGGVALLLVLRFHRLPLDRYIGRV